MTPTWPAAPGVPDNAGEPLTELDVLDAHSRRMGLIHDKLFKARELVRARLHPQSEAWERDLFTTLNDALYGVRGSPLVTDMRAALDARDAEHAAQVEAARREGREEAAKWHEVQATEIRKLHGGLNNPAHMVHIEAAASIRALPTAPTPAQRTTIPFPPVTEEQMEYLRSMRNAVVQPGDPRMNTVIGGSTPALDAVVQRAEQRVFEECAKIADGFTCGCCGMDGKVGAAIRSRAPGWKEGA